MTAYLPERANLRRHTTTPEEDEAALLRLTCLRTKTGEIGPYATRNQDGQCSNPAMAKFENLTRASKLFLTTTSMEKGPDHDDEMTYTEWLMLRESDEGDMREKIMRKKYVDAQLAARKEYDAEKRSHSSITSAAEDKEAQERGLAYLRAQKRRFGSGPGDQRDNERRARTLREHRSRMGGGEEDVAMGTRRAPMSASETAAMSKQLQEKYITGQEAKQYSKGEAPLESSGGSSSRKFSNMSNSERIESMMREMKLAEFEQKLERYKRSS